VQEWIGVVGAKTAYIERGSPWENGYIESFNARLRDELLDGEIFYTLREAQIVIESWRRHYNMIRPHASLGYKPPAPEVFIPAFAAWPAALRQPAPPAARKLKAIDVIDVLSDLFILQGIPAYIRSDNGPEFLAKAGSPDIRG